MGIWKFDLQLQVYSVRRVRVAGETRIFHKCQRMIFKSSAVVNYVYGLGKIVSYRL